MRAIQIDKFGGPEVLKYRTNVSIPEIKDNEVLIKVHVAAVNPTDTWTRDGAYPESNIKIYVPSFPWTPGRDLSGVVEKIGSNVSRFKIGDRVYTSCLTLSGGYAEYVAAVDYEIFPLPDELSFKTGASIGIPFFTSFRALFTRGHLKPGEIVLVHGASGGVGLASVQLALYHGCTVLGTAGSQMGLDLVKSLGVHAVFNHREEGYVQQIKEYTKGNKGVDLIVELVADKNLGKDVEMLAVGGRVMVIGTTAWNTADIVPRLLYMGELDIRGVAQGVTDESLDEYMKIHEYVIQGFKVGKLKALIGIEYPLEKAAEAQREQREHKQGTRGKIIINVID